MHVETRGKTRITLFDSVGECVRECRRATESRPDGMKNNFMRYIDDGLIRVDFYGRDVRSWGHLETIASQYWPEGMAIVQAMLDQLRDVELPRPLAYRRKRRFSEDDGDELDVDRLLGRQAHWEYRRLERAIAPGAITICCDVSGAWNIPASLLLWRGATAVCLTNLLEQAGYRVELWSVRHVSEAFLDKGDSYTAVRTKLPNEPVSIGEAICGVSAWFYRTAMLHSCNIHPASPDHGGGYSEHIGKFLDVVTGDPLKVVVSGVWSLAEATKFIRHQLEQLMPEQVLARK